MKGWRSPQKQKFLTTGLYMARVENPDNQYHLQEAHNTLQSHQDQFGTLAVRTSLLARVKYLLHHQDSEVLELLLKATTSDNVYDYASAKVDAHTMLGRFHEKCGDLENAVKSYQNAKKEAPRGKIFMAGVAEYRLRSLTN